MKIRSTCTLLVVVLTIMLLIPDFATVSSADEWIVSDDNVELITNEFAENRVLVVLSNEVSTSVFSHDPSSFPEIECSNVENLTRAATDIVYNKSMGIEVEAVNQADVGLTTFSGIYDIDEESFHQVLCLTLSEPGKENVIKASKMLMQRPDVIYAGPDYKMEIEATPNDPYYSSQWAASKIKLPQAWNIATGSSSVVVGVIDTGIDAEHPDLENRYNEDFSFTYDSAQSFDIDNNGHGTMVAGIIAAQGNNNSGVCGVGWNVQVASLKAFDGNGYSYSSYVARAINYATSKGIPILNLSAGWSSADVEYDTALNSVIANYRGLFVCSAGNKGINNDSNAHYPSNYRMWNLIAVGASTQADQRRGNSNYGKTTVDIFAPGDSILSCYPYIKCTMGMCTGTHHATGYHYGSGTSYAAPYVAGVAALILSKYPSLSTNMVKSRIMKGVDHISAFANFCVSGGRLNAYIALHNHSFSYSVTALNHRCTCSCGYDVTEAHEFSVSANEYYCIYCNYRTTVLPNGYGVQIEDS